MSKLSKHFVTIAGYYDKIEDCLAKIEQETNWIGLDGHLVTPEQLESVNEINLVVHKARNTFEGKDGP